jgi:hypothetical protein
MVGGNIGKPDSGLAHHSGVFNDEPIEGRIP